MPTSSSPNSTAPNSRSSGSRPTSTDATKPGGGTLSTAGGEGSAYSLLAEALDALVAAGELPAERRPLAEIAAWSAVHGLARLVLDGPLAVLPEPAREAALDRALTMIARGL